MSFAARGIKWLTGYERILVGVFVLSLPMVNPWVRGDGVGYYAYVHSLLMDGNLRFEDEWLAGNSTFLMSRVDANHRLKLDQYTSTGHVDNHFTVGPAILWAPFLAAAHAVVFALDRCGAHIAADGYSSPYTVTMGGATALYGFVGLMLAFRLARRFADERWAFWATLGIWFASPLPVYMYLNPSWSHAHSAFAVSLFLWYWHRTRGTRTYAQWAALGVMSGLMMNVYYPNALFMMVPGLESLALLGRAGSACPRDWPLIRRLLGAHFLFGVATLTAFLPTLITRQVIYGHPLQFGYGRLQDWYWRDPALWSVLFSPDHGLCTWTPIVVPSLVGLLWLGRRDRGLAALLGVSFFAYYYLISSFPTWDGISSFGNRFFVSWTPVFVLGLASALEACSKLLASKSAAVTLPVAVSFLMAWNLGFIFQWGTLMIPSRGPICWRQMVRSQVFEVPAKLYGTGKRYLLARRALLESIEREDFGKMAAKDSCKASGKTP